MNSIFLTRRAQPRAADGAALRFLYRTAGGRLILRALTRRCLSRACGRFMDSRASRILIKPFVRKNNIHMEDYLRTEYRCFNDCFCREIRPELRPIDGAQDALIAPCDGLLSAYRIEKGSVIPAKHSAYSISSMLGADPLAARFDGGLCLVFRLCVHHYHRYCYPDAGKLLRGGFLPGELHTVRPIALERYPVFVRNCREYALMETEHLGLVAQIEIGALLVGKIHNHVIESCFARGQEKGMFLYGGSTVVLLLEPGRVLLPELAFELSAQEMELPVRMGERIADIIEAN